MKRDRPVRLGLDMDGCLYSFDGALKEYICNSTGRSPEDMPDANCWDFFSTQWGLTLDEYREHTIAGIQAGHIFRIGEPHQDCIKTVKSLHEDYEIIFITSRSGFGQTAEICKRATIDWLYDHDIPWDGLIMAENKTNRGIHLLLDDAPHQIEEAVSQFQPVVVFDRPWNQHVDGVDRIYDWPEFEKYVRNRFNSIDWGL